MGISYNAKDTHGKLRTKPLASAAVVTEGILLSQSFYVRISYKKVNGYSVFFPIFFFEKKSRKHRSIMPKTDWSVYQERIILKKQKKFY